MQQARVGDIVRQSSMDEYRDDNWAGSGVVLSKNILDCRCLSTKQCTSENRELLEGAHASL